MQLSHQFIQMISVLMRLQSMLLRLKENNVHTRLP